jgi:hypothetical protein
MLQKKEGYNLEINLHAEYNPCLLRCIFIVFCPCNLVERGRPKSKSLLPEISHSSCRRPSKE